MKTKNIIIGLILVQIGLVGLCVWVIAKDQLTLGITCLVTNLFFIGVNLNTLKRIKKGGGNA